MVGACCGQAMAGGKGGTVLIAWQDASPQAEQQLGPLRVAAEGVEPQQLLEHRNGELESICRIRLADKMGEIE